MVMRAIAILLALVVSFNANTAARAQQTDDCNNEHEVLPEEITVGRDTDGLSRLDARSRSDSPIRVPIPPK
jgi:hypothetical protein